MNILITCPMGFPSQAPGEAWEIIAEELRSGAKRSSHGDLEFLLGICWGNSGMLKISLTNRLILVNSGIIVG